MWTVNDLRIGDRIYCKDWEDRMTLRRKLANHGIYTDNISSMWVHPFIGLEIKEIQSKPRIWESSEYEN